MATEAAPLEPKTYVGFDSITRQIERRLLRRGFQFNIMLAGASGLGKSTLVNTLFAADLAPSHGRKKADETVARTPQIATTTKEIVENGVRLQVTVIDTPGFGDQINNDHCWDPLVKYIKDQHSEYLRKELTAQRDKYLNDKRVHAVLYFIEPTGHGLKPLDAVVLKKLGPIANVIPIIAKSDALTIAERDAFKARLREDFVSNRIKVYPYDSDDYDLEEQQYTEMVRAMIPFAVVGSTETAVVDGQQVPVRRSRHGTINIADPAHCEFSHLRSFLVSTHLQDLIDTTAHTHFESFRSRQLVALKENAEHKKKF